MAKNSIDAYGAEGKSNVLFFDPDKLTLVTDESHPLYDSRVHLPLDESMVRNIMFHNVRQPIEVSKNPETGDVEVVTGRQRVKNAREANRRLRERGEPILLIPAVAVKVAAGQRALTLSAAMASENAIRQQETPLSRAEKMAKQLALGRSENELGIIFGCTAATVRATLQLLECCSAVQKAVDAGQITVTHAKQLAKLSPEEQRAKVKELIDAGGDAKPHARARKQREVLGDKKACVKTRSQIEKELAKADGERAEALRWVLGLDANSDAEATL
jgi:ParB family chromosome partitioning protein